MQTRKLGKTGIEVYGDRLRRLGANNGTARSGRRGRRRSRLPNALIPGTKSTNSASTSSTQLSTYGGGRSERIEIGEVVRGRIGTRTMWPRRCRRRTHSASPPRQRRRGLSRRSRARVRRAEHCATSAWRPSTSSQWKVWNDDWTDRGDWREAVEALRSSGEIRFFGISINDHQPANSLKLIATGAVDTVAGDLQRLRPVARRRAVLPPARERNVGVIARVPLDEGGLTATVRPGSEFADDDHRSPT